MSGSLFNNGQVSKIIKWYKTHILESIASGKEIVPFVHWYCLVQNTGLVPELRVMKKYIQHLKSKDFN